MASARAMIERRRSSRVTARIAVKIFPNGAPAAAPDAQPETHAEATAVSRCGALLRVPFCVDLGSHIAVQHLVSEEMRECRVVRVIPPKQDGLFELGVEILHPTQNFWGIPFPDERHLG
jgi:hypothetical protein